MKLFTDELMTNAPRTLLLSFLTALLAFGYIVMPKTGFGPEPELRYYISLAGVLQFFVLVLVLLFVRFLKGVKG